MESVFGYIRGMNESNWERLLVWQKSMMIAKDCYQIIMPIKEAKDFGFHQHLIKTMVSVSSNIVEGATSGSPAGFHKHLNHATGSAAELSTQLDLTVHFGYTSAEKVEGVKEEIKVLIKQLNALKASLRRRHNLNQKW